MVDPDDIDRMDNRVPDDIHPDRVEDYLRGRFSETTMSDTAVRRFAEGIAEKRRSENRIPDDPRDVNVTDQSGRGIQVGEIYFDSGANRWRHEDTGHFVSSDEL